MLRGFIDDILYGRIVRLTFAAGEDEMATALELRAQLLADMKNAIPADVQCVESVEGDDGKIYRTGGGKIIAITERAGSFIKPAMMQVSILEV